MKPNWKFYWKPRLYKWQLLQINCKNRQLKITCNDLFMIHQNLFLFHAAVVLADGGRLILLHHIKFDQSLFLNDRSAQTSLLYLPSMLTCWYPSFFPHLGGEEQCGLRVLPRDSTQWAGVGARTLNLMIMILNALTSVPWIRHNGACYMRTRWSRSMQIPGIQINLDSYIA